jgi:L-ribulokinase
MEKYVIGIDYGTNTARAIIVNTANGEEIGTGIAPYPHGENGIVLNSADPNVARHHPFDYLHVTKLAVRQALKTASGFSGFNINLIIGIGIDTTASTVLALDINGVPLAFSDEYKEDIDTMAWLWKDHSSVAEAEEITQTLKKNSPKTLERIGGAYSSEWFWSKLLRFARVAPKAYERTATWIEIGDWFSGWLCGVSDPFKIARGICTAGHKGLYDSLGNGFPGEDVIKAIDPVLVKIGDSLQGKVLPIGEALGRLAREPAEFLGLPKGIAVAVPEIDAHIGALGSGINNGRMVKILGTSGVDLVIAAMENPLVTIPGVSGVVPHSIMPGYLTIEAGQSALGDIYGWYVNRLAPQGGDHISLTTGAEKLKPGESGLLGLDWYNGNRTILIDQRLSGLVLGMNLQTKPEHIYRSLIEATAFGSRVIMDRFSEYGINVNEIVASGGLPGKNSLVMQIFADVLERPLKIPKSEHTAALGAAIAATVAAERMSDNHISIQLAVDKMTAFRETEYHPDSTAVPVYRELYGLYKEIHDAFGTDTYQGNLKHVMKKLIQIREKSVAK